MGSHHRVAGAGLSLALVIGLSGGAADSGWDHYANRWEVLEPEGQVIATRTLLHPHVDEQPFTRSLSGIHIPPPGPG